MNDSVQLQSDLDKVLLWCNTWNKTLNFSKCNIVQFSTKRHTLNTKYSLDGESLTIIPSYKYLGVLYKNEFSWIDHIDYVAAKASRVLNFLRRNFKQALLKLKKNSLLFKCSHYMDAEYGCSAWDPGTKTCIEELKRIQKRAVRFVSSSYDFKKKLFQHTGQS